MVRLMDVMMTCMDDGVDDQEGLDWMANVASEERI